MTVRIHIDRLLLDGFSFTAGQARQVQASVERELSRLLSEPSANKAGFDATLGAKSAAVPTASSGLFNPPANASPKQLGRHIAQSIHGGFRSAK